MTALCSALALLAAFAITGTDGQGQQAVDVGAILTGLISPDKELIGGILKVMDQAHEFDATNTGCANRGVCMAFSAATVTRRDGSTGVDSGFLRQIVDGFGGVLFDITRPVMEVVGLGAVAREEVSFTTFLIDLIDSAIISVTRVLAGRRVSRQFEEFSPVLTLVEPAMGLLRNIPPAYVGSMVDFMVDVTNVANRKSGLYNLARAGGLGYAYGGDNARDGADICTQLNGPLGDAGCDNDGVYFPLGMINPINENKLGQLLRIGDTNPILNRNLIGTDVMQYNAFDIGDLVDPKALLCKTNNLLSSVDKHVGVVGEYGEAVEYYDLDEVDHEYAAKVDDDTSEYDAGLEKVGEAAFSPEDERAVRLHQKIQEIEEEQTRLNDDRKRVKDPEETDRDKFVSYCAGFNLEAKRKFMKKMLDEQTNATATDVEETTEVEEYVTDDISEDDDDDMDIVEVKRKEKEPQMNDLEALARLGDRSLLVDKLDVEEGNEQSDVEEYVTALDVLTNGKVEKVVIIEGKRKTLLVQFDSVAFRDAVLRASRSPEARSVTKARLRKPKVKDLKHVESLRH